MPVKPREPEDAGREGALHTGHLKADLGRHAVRGGAITVGAQVVKVVVQFAAMAVLARLLGPAAFGLIAMTTAVLTFLEFFKDLGLSAVTAQREHLTQTQVSALFWLNTALGIVAAAVTAALAPALPWAYGEPALTEITLWLSLGFVLSGLSTQHLALLRRQMRFGMLAFIQVGAEIIGMAVAVVAALEGAGYWALVAQRLAWVIALLIGGWSTCRWRPGHYGTWREMRDLVGFGGNVTVSNLVGFFSRSLDQMLIGWYWGAAPLGLYERASKLLLMPVTTLTTPLYLVAMPALSRLVDEPDRYRRSYLRTIEKLAMITMPAAAAVIAAPDWVVSMVFGAQWLAAAPMAAWLALAALYQPITYTASWLLMSQNRTAQMRSFSFVNAGIVIAGIALALPHGATTVAAVTALNGLLLRTPLLFLVVGRKGPVQARHVLGAVMPSLLAAGAVLGAVLALRRLDTIAALPPTEGAILLVAFSIFLSLLCFAGLPRGREALKDLARLPALALRKAGA